MAVTARTRRRRIALVTSAALAQLLLDEQRLLAALRGLGVHAEPAVWDDPRVSWSDFDGVLIRTCWDYFLCPADFLAWLAAVERAGPAIWNPPDLVRWNADKRYLRALADRGVGIIPTHWLEPGASVSLADLLSARQWEDAAVVKPAIAASAHGLWRTSGETAPQDQARLDRLLAQGAALVQPFVPEVVTAGEWSFVFLGATFSHAVRKLPRDGDFRVQQSFGGSASPSVASPALVDDAQRALEAGCAAAGMTTYDTLYARVDGIERDSRLLVMELECIEPQLFLVAQPGAVDRLADAVVRALG